MNLEEFAQTCHDHADEMAYLLGQIVEGPGDEGEWQSMQREAGELSRKWREFSQSKEVLEAQ